VRIALPFDAMMAFALAVLSISPAEPNALGWRILMRQCSPQ